MSNNEAIEFIDINSAEYHQACQLSFYPCSKDTGFLSNDSLSASETLPQRQKRFPYKENRESSRS